MSGSWWGRNYIPSISYSYIYEALSTSSREREFKKGDIVGLLSGEGGREYRVDDLREGGLEDYYLTLIKGNGVGEQTWTHYNGVLSFKTFKKLRSSNSFGCKHCCDGCKTKCDLWESE